MEPGGSVMMDYRSRVEILTSILASSSEDGRAYQD
jgi:hypothetical protein